MLLYEGHEKDSDGVGEIKIDGAEEGLNLSDRSVFFNMDLSRQDSYVHTMLLCQPNCQSNRNSDYRDS